MKKIITLAAAAAASLAMLASCNKDGVEQGVESQMGDQPRTVTLSMVYPETPGTRAEGTPVTAADYIDFETGHIFFINSVSGNIELHVGIDNGAGSQQVTLQDLLDEEAVITGVPASATMAILVGNEIGAKLYSDEGINVNMENKNLLDYVEGSDYDLFVVNINESTGGVDNVPVISSGMVNVTAGKTPESETPFDATVTLPLRATAARVEIEQISVKPVEIGSVTSTITNFTVEGIYINNYHPFMSAFGITGREAIYNNGAIPANYATTGTTQYATGGNAFGLADYIDRAATAGVLAPETDGKVWAYNVFGGAAGNDVPHIVIKLSSVTYTISNDLTNPVTINQPRFITVTGFIDEGGDRITAIGNGRVYSFADLAFDYSNLSTIPEPGTEYAVQAIVTVDNWEVISVKPEY